MQTIFQQSFETRKYLYLRIIFCDQALAEKTGKGLADQVSTINKKITESNLQLNDLDNANKKSAAENNDLLHQLGEIDQNVSLLQKLR